MKLLVYVAFAAFLVGCSQGPKPWEKGELAHEQMFLGGADKLQTKINEHVFSSKEGSTGGNGVGGGGCGCN